MLINIYKNISEILQAYLETYDKHTSLKQILSLITYVYPDSVPYILMVSKKEAILTHLVSSHIIDPEYKKLLQEVPIDKNGSACGMAAFYKKRVILDNLIYHNAYKGIKKLIKKINIKECWAFPILNKEKYLVGTLSIYFTCKQEERNKLIKKLEHLLPFIAILIDHEKKEKEIKQQNTLFDDIERFSNSYTWEYNLKTTEVWWSKNSYNLLKLDPKKQKPSYETFYKILTEKSQKEMVATIEDMLKTKQKKRLELTFKHLPDQIFYEEKNIICNENGDPIKLIGIIKDITEERTLEKERIKLDERLQILTNNVPGMVYSFKIDQNNQALLLDCNDYVYNIYEITKNEALNDVKLLFNQTKTQYQKGLFEAIENSRKSLTLFEFEGEIINPSGKEKWTTCQAWPKKQKDGSVVWTGIVLDTTEKNRIKEEKRIVETEAQKLEQEKDALGIELTQLIDTANAPIFGIDKKGNITEWNQKAEEITGYSKAEVKGKSFVETYITQEYKGSVKDVLDRALVGDETANYEVPIYSKHGQRIMVLLNATTRRNTKGEIIGVVGVGQDITEIDNLRRDLSISNARWQSIIKNEELAITEVSLNLEIEFCSNIVKTAQHLFNKEDLLGQSIKNFFKEDEWDLIWKKKFNRLKEAGSYFVNHYDVKDGIKTITIQNQWFPHYEEGRLVNIICISSDITEVNTTKEKLETINRHFIQTQEASLTGSWEWDIKRDRIWWSDETFKLFEVEKSSFINTYQNYLNLLDQESQQKVNEQVNTILKNGLPYKHIVKLKKNNSKRLEGIGYLIKDKNGANQKLIGVVKDVTNEVKLEKQKNILDKQLQESQEKRQSLYKKIIKTQEDERKRLARDVHDNLAQQLVYLKIKMESLKKESSKSIKGYQECNICEELDSCIDQLQSSIQTTRSIAQDLRPPQLDLLDINDLMENYISQINHPKIAILSKVSLIEKEISPTIKEIIFRIAKEGINNAIKHANPNKIEILIKSTKERITLDVTDDGRGLNKDDMLKPGSFGLIGIEEQLIPVNGCFSIKHEHQKTKLKIKIPL